MSREQKRSREKWTWKRGNATKVEVEGKCQKSGSRGGNATKVGGGKEMSEGWK